MNISLEKIPDIDYLVVGHLTCDLVGDEVQLGGSAAYVSLTVKSLGLRPAIITSFADEALTQPLSGIPIINLPTMHSTTFSNTNTPFGRQQTIYYRADNLDDYLVPQPWKRVPILHLAPIAQEIEPGFVRSFPDSFIGISPQGWMRAWDERGIVHPTEWLEGSFVLPYANAVVISLEDVDYNEQLIEEIAASCHILAVTEAEEFDKIYKLGVLAIPTNLEYYAMQPESGLIELEAKDDQGYKFNYYAAKDDPEKKPVYWKRKDYPDVVYRTQEVKIRAIMQEILYYHVLGRPLLVGTTSVEMSDRLPLD